MVEIIEVKSGKDRREFVDFPTKLYKDSPYYVHPLRSDEMGLFSPKKNVSFDECDIVFYLAKRDGVTVGRICGILQKVYNEKTNTKRVRFSRLDFIDDVEVARALLNAIEQWAKSKGMDTIHGPLGFNDLDREGLLIKGFDRLATFEENYNYPYYKDHIEACGYEKEIDYLASRINLPEGSNDRVKRLAELVLKRNNLKVATAKNKKEYLKKYADGIFEVLDDAYKDLYGVIPYNEKQKKSILSQFQLIINLKYLITLVDENDRPVAFGFGLPDLSMAVKKSKGRLFPLGLFRIMKVRNGGLVGDFGLIGIRREYANRGLAVVILNHVIEGAKEVGVKIVETNHTLETNHNMLQLYKNFDSIEQHKTFRCFVKKLEEKKPTTEAKSTAKAKPRQSKASTSKSKVATKKKTASKTTTTKKAVSKTSSDKKEKSKATAEKKTA